MTQISTLCKRSVGSVSVSTSVSLGHERQERTSTCTVLRLGVRVYDHVLGDGCLVLTVVGHTVNNWQKVFGVLLHTVHCELVSCKGHQA